MYRENKDMETQPPARANRMETTIRERDITVVVGKTGMGKTRWTRQHLRTQHRVIIVDPMNEHEGQPFDSTDDMIDHIMENRVFRIRTEFVDDFPTVCAISYAARRNTLVIEEAQRVLPAGGKELPAKFADIIYRGRHRRVSLVLVSQRASTVNIAARSQWTRLVVFNQTEPNDISWIQDTTGFDLSPALLRQSEYYDVRPGGFEKLVLADTRRTPIDNVRDESDTIESENNETEENLEERGETE